MLLKFILKHTVMLRETGGISPHREYRSSDFVLLIESLHINVIIPTVLDLQQLRCCNFLKKIFYVVIFFILKITDKL